MANREAKAEAEGKAQAGRRFGLIRLNPTKSDRKKLMVDGWNSSKVKVQRSKLGEVAPRRGASALSYSPLDIRHSQFRAFRTPHFNIPLTLSLSFNGARGNAGGIRANQAKSSQKEVADDECGISSCEPGIRSQVLWAEGDLRLQVRPNPANSDPIQPNPTTMEIANGEWRTGR